LPSKTRDERLLTFARELRKEMTPEERKLWYTYLRTHPHFRFRRQEIIGSYIADFYCAKAALIIEIDGSQHYEEHAIEYDAARTAYFSSLNLKVLRFSNLDINLRMTDVCHTIEHHLSAACAAGSPRDS